MLMPVFSKFNRVLFLRHLKREPHELTVIQRVAYSYMIIGKTMAYSLYQVYLSNQKRVLGPLANRKTFPAM